MNPVDALAGLDRDALGRLARELLLCGHLIDRSGMPHLIAAYGLEGMRDIAIDEWMGASPIYTERIRRLLGIDDRHDVEAIFKGMQFDIGAPHQFMDFRYRIDGPDRGEFWLDHCGALMDVEPMGEEFVVAMCHDIEDPTFDATAWATNPRARMRPIHRPPREPAGRHPHCHWTVTISSDVEELAEPEVTTRIRATHAATVELARHAGEGTGGLGDYRGALDADLRLEDFSAALLRDLIDEICLQQHLLALSFLAAVEARHGTEAAVEVGERQLVGIAGLTAERLARELGAGPGAEGVARVLDVHPLFRPAGYVEREVLLDGDRVELRLRPCPARQERGIESWIGLLADGHDRAIGALVRAVDPTARAEGLAAEGDELRWEVTVSHEPEAEASEVELTRFSTGADYELRSTPVTIGGPRNG